ncbi:flippase [Candidatus Omnitrophota bacterium]
MHTTHKANLKTIAGGSFWVCIGLILTYVLEYTNRVIIGRLFGPSDYGLIALALSISILCASLSLLGLQTGITRYVAIAPQLGHKVGEVIISGLKVFLPVSLLCSTVLLLNRGRIINYFSDSPFVSPLITIFILLIPLIAIADYFYSCLRGLKLARQAILSREVALRLVVLTVLIVMALFNIKRLILVPVAYVIGFSLCVIMLGMGIKRHISLPEALSTGSFKTKELILFSLPLLFSFFLKRFGGQMCNILVGFFRNTTEVGYISAALAFSRLVRFPLNAVQFMFLPVMSEYWHQGKHEELKIIFTRLSNWLFCLSGFIFVLFVLNAKLIIAMTFGEKFLPAYRALVVLSAGQFFNTICGPMGSLLLATGDSKRFFIGDFFSLIIALLLYVVITPGFGFLGAAYVTMFYLVLLKSIYLAFAYRTFKINPFNKKTLSALAFIGLLILFVNNFFSEAALWGRILLPAAMYLFIIVATGLLEKDSLTLLKGYFKDTFNKR